MRLACLEGGGIESDGAGTLLSTESVIVEPNRNAGVDDEALRQYLIEILGAERLLTLTNGQIEGDDTDGHIDTLARFLTPTTIAYVSCEDPKDSHYHELERMKKELEALRTKDGAPYELIPLPLPSCSCMTRRSARCPPTYANFPLRSNRCAPS